MTDSQKLRHECLLYLYGSRPLAISADHIHRSSRRDGGTDFAIAEIRAELVFLLDEGLVVKITDTATGEIRYRITSKGCNHWENRE